MKLPLQTHVCFSDGPIVLALLLSMLSVSIFAQDSALQTSNRVAEEVLSYQQTIEALEIQYGGFDRNLLEPLQGLAQAYIDSGDFEAAQEILGRQLQIVRTLEGLEGLQQLPILEAMIANAIRIYDWDSVSESFELIHLIHSRDPGALESDRVNSKNDLALWELIKIYTDNPRARTRNFLVSRNLQRENLNYLEDIYPEDSPELLPWLYQHAVLQYQLVNFVIAEDELGYDARDEIVRKEGRDRISYLREGLNTISRMRIIIQAQGNPEAEAMAMIYEADFQMILRLGTAMRLYRDAMDKLREAGIEESRIQEFFNQPVALPVQEFHLSLADALAARIVEIPNGVNSASVSDTFPEPLNTSDATTLGSFVAWNESLPLAERPPVPSLAADITVPLNHVTLEFTVNSRGNSSNPKVVYADPDETRVRRNAIQAVDRLQFRPYFEGDRPRRSERVSLHYYYPQDL